MFWLSAEVAMAEGHMDKTETAAKPELTRRLFVSRTAMSKAPVLVGRMWREKVGVQRALFANHSELLAFSL